MRLRRSDRASLNAVFLSVFTVVLFFHKTARAEITLNSVTASTASAVKGIPKEENVTATIFAGTAGTICDSDEQSTTSTCNNCDTENLELTGACNTNRVHSNLQLTINYSSNNKSGSAIVGDASGNDLVGVTEQNVVNASAGQQASVTLIWSELCGTTEIGAGTDCGTDGSGQISVGIDGNGDGDLADSEDDRTSVTIVVQNTITDQIQVCDNGEADEATGGLCDFSVFPGDEKVFIQNLSVPSGFPNGEGTAKLEKLRFFFTAAVDDSNDGLTSFNSINHASSSKDFEVDVDDSGNLSTDSDFIDGLTNGTEFFFTAATVDEAGNVGWAIPTLRLDDNSQYLTRGTHSATPEVVSGLLSEDVQCFIATAAFGSPFERHVKTLRLFRDQILKKTWLGRQIVKGYYRLSPSVADQIRSNNGLKALTRWALWPVIKVSELLIEVGWRRLQVIFFGLLFLIPFLVLAVTFRSRRRQI